MSSEKEKIFIERVNYRMLIIALIMMIIGLIALYISTLDYLVGHQALQVVVRNIGGLLIVTVAITILWELWAKRAFLDEVLVKVQMAEEVKLAGLTRVTDSFQKSIEWEKLFESVNKLDIFIAYGHSWRSAHAEALRNVASRKGARIRIVLPDYDDDLTVSELARRFNYSKEKLIGLIQEAESDFKSLIDISRKNGAQVNIWLSSITPQFSFYRFDRIVIFALYSHSRERVSFPTFVAEMGGTLYNFIRKDFDAIMKSVDSARCITNEEQ